MDHRNKIIAKVVLDETKPYLNAEQMRAAFCHFQGGLTQAKLTQKSIASALKDAIEYGSKQK